ncbi:MAG: hypothetical protein MJZ20_11915 [Bacteroidaceae bacterium]|nr:hypothetical protein [Bacteroidaceae bacterium]
MAAYWTIKKDDNIEDIKTIKPFEESQVNANVQQFPPKIDFSNITENSVPAFSSSPQHSSNKFDSAFGSLKIRFVENSKT